MALIRNGGAGLIMWRPGCDDLHQISTGPDGWTYDGNAAAPTISPSILVRRGLRPGDPRCHSFIRNGRWEFLPDCTHALAGQTVPMVPIPKEWDAA